MRKLSSKIVAAILAGTMVLGMIGCGNTTTSKEESKVTSESKKEESKTSESAESKTEEVVEEVLPGAGEIVYPLESEKLTFWSSSVKPASGITEYQDWPFWQYLTEATGIDLEMQYPAQGTDSGQAQTLMLTQSVLPDIIAIWITAGDAQTMLDDGMIYDLTEYIPKYAPDYWKFINDNNLLQAVKSDSGSLYGFHSFAGGEMVANYMGPVIRKDWLDECGLDMPVTMEDWEEVLVAFKEKYNATFSTVLSWFNETALASGTDAFGGIKTPGNGYYLDDAGNVQYPFVEDAYKEQLEILNKWYDMGLIDKDMFTIDANGLRAKVLNNEVGIIYTAIGQLTNYLNDAEAENTGAIFEPFSYPRVAEGAPTSWINTTADDYYGWAAMISTSCPEEKLISALQFLNYGYTEEGLKTWNFGKEGVTFTVDSNDKVQYTELVTADADGLNQAVKKHNTSGGRGVTVQLAEAVMLKNRPECEVAVATWIDNSEGRSHRIPGGIALTAEEQAEFTDIDNALTTHQSEMALQFITGEVSFDKWNEYVAEQEALGYKRAVELEQAAYERYATK